MKALNLIGQKFGKLIVVEKAPSQGGHTNWKCKCDCGNICIIRTNNLRNGHTTQCNKCGHNKYKKFPIKSNRRLYDIWRNMINRTNTSDNPKNKIYQRGNIKVCGEWINDFETFAKWAYDNGYNSFLTIDRIDNSKGYSPNNCRWATMKEQQNHRTNNVLYKWNGEEHTLTEWSEIQGINLKTLESRIYLYKWNIDRALSTISNEGRENI